MAWTKGLAGASTASFLIASARLPPVDSIISFANVLFVNCGGHVHLLCLHLLLGGADVFVQVSSRSQLQKCMWASRSMTATCRKRSEFPVVGMLGFGSK